MISWLNLFHSSLPLGCFSLSVTKVIISLSNVTSSSFIVNVFEMYDLNGNLAENIFYQFDCNFNINVDVDENEPQYILFPNPSNGLINLNLKQDYNNINIYDIQGKLVLSEELLNGTHQININKAGFYYLEINELSFMPIIIK